MMAETAAVFNAVPVLAAAGLILLSAAVTLTAIVVVNTIAFRPPRANAGAKPFDPGVPEPAVLERLSGAIQIPTVSNADYEATDFAPFREFMAYIEKAWPLFHAETERTIINGYTLLFRLAGKNAALKPYILMAHYDVVPLENESAWTWPGFSGKIEGGRVWGRGTLDIKSQLCAHLEAAENLLRRGWRPEQDIYFIYGHDEETGGRNGAQKAAEYLESKGIQAEGVLDEGGFVISGAFRGVEAPLALIGLAEKGFCNFEITVEGEGGHSSMPPRHTSLGTAAALVRAIEDNPLPFHLAGPVKEMFRAVAGEMGLALRMAMANIWLFRPLIFKMLAAAPTTRSLVATSFAATMARAGSAANVLPQKTSLTVNVRILPGDTVDQVETHIAALAKRVIARDRAAGSAAASVAIRKAVPQEASAVSPATGSFYEKIASLAREFYPNALVTPYLVMGGTDARKYQGLSSGIYRFTPVLVTDAEKNTAHGVDEAISAENYLRMIRFFERFMGGENIHS